MEINEKQFIAGFNNGYLLTEHEPNMITILLSDVQSINSYLTGMSFGQKEYELELTKNRLNEIQHLRQKVRNEKENNRD